MKLATPQQQERDVEAIVAHLSKKGERSLDLMGKFPGEQVLWGCMSHGMLDQRFYALTASGAIYDLQWDGHYRGAANFQPKEIGRISRERCQALFSPAEPEIE